MENKVQPPSYSLPPTKDVLGEHLHQKVTQVLVENLVDSTTTVCNGCSLPDKITGMLLERSVKEIHVLLQENKLLLEAVRLVMMVLHEDHPHLPQTLPADTQQDGQNLSLEDIGEVLFDQICNMKEPMAAEITGMLLELDLQTLAGLIDSDGHLLEAAVRKAKEVLTTSPPSTLKKPSSPKLECADKEVKNDAEVEPGTTKESLGREIYGRILSVHPVCASDLTGMILEMDFPSLKLLIGNETQLQVAIAKAYTEWTRHSSHRHSSG